MKNYRIAQRAEYNYTCTNCGNTFSRDYPVEPYECYDCDHIYSFEEDVDFVEETEQFCPICKQYFTTSDYLNELFKDDEHAKWLSNMVMHYRHYHQTSWDKQFGRYGHLYCDRIPNYNYDEQKKLYNERAKRQIIRKATDFLIAEGYTPEDFLKLQHTTEETMNLARKKLKSPVLQ